MPDDTSSYQRIWDTVKEIPCGHVATYGQIARLAGLPRRARMVGYALHQTPDDIELPWHRVINAKGEISFPRGSEPYKRQAELLAIEGVELVNGRIDLRRYGWAGGLDELLWKL
ncbi:MAG: MGMT family protein [Gammaproteobacteria bacterium]